MERNIIELTLPERAKFAMDDIIIYSDTLFSAITNCYVKLYGDEKIEDFINKIKVSSIFLGLEIVGEKIHLFPKPMIEPKLSEESDKDSRDNIKTWKKIKFLSKNLFEGLVNGNFKEKKIDYKSWNGIAFTKDEYDKFINESVKNMKIVETYSEAKNSLNRFNNQSEELFFKNILEFQVNGDIKPFLYFFIDNLNTEIRASIRLLVDEGLGGDRSTGKGMLSGMEEKKLLLGINCEKYFSFSLIFPKDMTEAKKAQSYKLVKRGGYVFFGKGTGWRKDRIRMFDIGAVFSEKVEGENRVSKIDINRDGNPVKIYHYGKAYMIGGSNAKL